MAKPLTDEYEVQFSDGWRAERLPIGSAAGRWWVTFVVTSTKSRIGPDVPDRDRMPHWMVLLEDLRSRFRFRGVDGPLGSERGGGFEGGDDLVFQVRSSFEQNETTVIEVEYLLDGALVTSESIRLA